MNNKEVLGLNKITKTRLKELCKKHKLYQTPHLNDQLYLHYQGFQAIENLNEYTGLKCLWLESNAISEIQGLDCQPELKCLFLQNNLIKKIENLHSCLVLDTLNLASNHITRVENCGIDVLPVLSTLNLSRNYLRNSEGLRELVNCRNLWSLDLSHNRIDDILVVKIFANMPELRVLVLQGNPVVSQVPQYRKTLILECKNLTYLDSRPVFPKDRACAEAWKRGGYEEERRENERWVREDRKKIRDSVNATLRLRQKQGGGDVQLLESTDDEEENTKPKKLKQIPEEVVNADLEITGVDQAGKTEDTKRGMEPKTSESSLSDSSDSEGSALESADGLDEESNESVKDIQMHPNRDQTSIEANCSNIQSQLLDEQVEQNLETNKAKDLVTSGDTINMLKVVELHDKEAKFKIEPTALEDATQNVENENKTHSISDNEEGLTKPLPPKTVAMRSATSFSQPTSTCNESSTLLSAFTSDPSLASDSSSNGSSISYDTDTMEISDNADNTKEYMEREDCSKDSNLKLEDREKEATKYEEDKNSVTDEVVLTKKFSFDISSESQFGDSELSLPSITEEEEGLQNLDLTFEIGLQEKIQLQYSTFLEQISPSPTWETGRNLSDVETSKSENTQTIPEIEDSGYFNIFNSIEASERTLTSDDELEGLPALECVLSNQQDDSEISVWQDVILKKLMDTEVNGANEDKNETMDSLPQSEMMTSSKANTLSSSLFVENSDEEMTLDEVDASTWLDKNLAASVETVNQEPFMEKIAEEEVLSEKTDDSASTDADGEKSYQSDGSSLLEYILNREAEYNKLSPEICIEEFEDEKQFAGNDEDETSYEDISLQTIFTTNEEEVKSPSEELNNWIENDEDSASDENVSLQNMLATIARNREENSITEGLDAEQLNQWLEKEDERALEEKLSLQHLLATLEEEQEEKLPSDEFNKRRIQLEQWLGENEGKVEDSDEDEELGEMQEYIYTQSIEDNEESLSSMYNTELRLCEDTAFEEDNMLQSILKKIEEEENFALETVDEKSENMQEWLEEAKDKCLGGISAGSGLQNSFSCSSPYEEVFDYKHFSLISDARLEGCNISQENPAELTQEEVSEDSSEDSVLTRLPLDDRTVTLDSGSAMNGETVNFNDSWWERTLVAARENTEPPKETTNDESFEETINQTQFSGDNVEASALLEQILTKTHEKKVEIHSNHREPPLNDVIDESKPPTTIRDVLSSFNKVAENITTTRYLTTFALTRDFSTLSSDQINRQVEEMNREQRARVSQMIDRVYAQKDKYVDNLEVVDGRLMVVKRTTGEFEELPLPPTSSSKYTSCGVSTTRANSNDSDCDDDDDDDYGTALSEDEPDDDDDGDIEQHASDTKIKKIPYLSAAYGNESSTSTGMTVEDNCHWEQRMDSNHKAMGLCDESDAVAATEWMEKGAPCPAGWVTTDKGNGEEKASLMRKLCGGTTESDLTCRKEMDFGGPPEALD